MVMWDQWNMDSQELALDLDHGNTYEGLLFELPLSLKSTWCIVFANEAEERFYIFPN